MAKTNIISLCRNYLKNREFGKEGPQNFCSQRATIAGGQGASENENSEANPTTPKTDSSCGFGIYAGILASTEIGLGSILHAFHVPFSGHFLSLNQLFCLNCALQQDSSKHSSTWISLIASSLKSFSPIGKKLTPMLAISMQGALFNLGCLLFGNGFFGRTFGATLLSLWGFVQPILIYTFIFGSAYWDVFYRMNETVEQWGVPENFLMIVFLSVVGVKIFISWVIVGIVMLFPRTASSYMEKMQNLSNGIKTRPKLSSQSMDKSKVFFTVLRKDMCNPTFLTMLIGISCLTFFTQESFSWWLWQLLRCSATAFILFYIVRIFPVERAKHWIGKFPTFKEGLNVALNYLKS